MQSPRRYEQNVQRAHPVSVHHGLNYGLISAGCATLPPNALAPAPSGHAVRVPSRLPVPHVDPIERTSTGSTTCSAKMLFCAVCVYSAAVLYFAYRLLLVNSQEQPVLAGVLGVALLAVALRRAQLKRTAQHQQEMRVRHARALRRAGEARLSGTGSSARLDSADYLRVARGVNSAPMPRRPTDPAGQGPLNLLDRHSAITPIVVDGVVVCEIPSCGQAKAGIVDFELGVTAGVVGAISLPTEHECK